MNESFDPVRGPRPGAASRVPMHDPQIDPPPEVLARYRARVLDPTTATLLPGQPPVRGTVYVADRLLVSGAADQKARAALEEAARRFGLTLVGDDPRRAMRSREVATRAELPVDQLPIRVTLVPAGPGPVAAPDAWAVLQTYRGLVGRDSVAQRQVSLDHLLRSCRHTSGSPFVLHSGYDPGVPAASYAAPGWGGRQPISWLGAEPVRGERAGRRPVVAVLDTGCGAHSWLPVPEVVSIEPMVLDVPIANPELSGVTQDPLDGVLDTDAGHGTFIAGLVRQFCPDADILAVAVMGGDGWVAESNLLDAVTLLLQRQQIAISSGDASRIIDVVSLSLGYYHELPDDVSFDPLLLAPLRGLAELGVAVVAAAGNDATTRPMYPAAFAPWPGGIVPAPERDRVPLLSVGALNPNRTIALFSNAGRWVSCHRPGASLISTFPTTFNGSEQPAYQVAVAGEGVRATIDPDDFTGGFGVWSGTSFAAPVLAGQLAARLCAEDLSDLSPAAAVPRGWRAVTACTGIDRP